MTDRVGQQLGNYRLLRLLGRGGFAEVYLGEHVYLKSQAALKLLHLVLKDEEEEAFLREAQTLARLTHPHIVRVLDFAVEDGTPFLVMEYATNGTLRQRHPSGARVPLDSIIPYVQQVASALQYAHAQRLIHRDVKPENMLLGARDEVLLSDFGLAMLAPRTHSYSTHAVAHHVAGTSPYLAPEQLHGQSRTASDQYALGVVIYEWLCGTPPFQGSPIEVAMQHLSVPPSSLREQVPDLSPTVEEVVLRALAKDPQDRFASVQEFARALEQASREALHHTPAVSSIQQEEAPPPSQEQQDIASSSPKPAPIWKVPPTFTPLIGREEDVTSVCALLKQVEVRLLTLLGTGGIGKTRLSIQVAAEMRQYFAGGACFAGLAPISDPGLVVHSLAQELGIQESGGQPIFEQVKAFLRDRQVLLLLDNFEQVVVAAAQVEELLAACPAVKVLVTSRAVLHLRAEHEFPVPPLSLPDLTQVPESGIFSQSAAVTLFVERARSILPGFQITPANARAIAEICVRLDGLPLAIELAAARIKLLPPQALLTRLSQRFQVLTSGARTLPTRQQTLRNTLKWSYDLLDVEEQQFFRLLAVFVNGCSLEAAEALSHDIGNETADVLNTIASLIDKSLVQQTEQDGEEPRLLMLETVREYGLECLRERGEAEAVQRGHAFYYLALAEEAEPHLRGAQQVVWLSKLEREQENLGAALDWFLEHEEAECALCLSGALGYFWRMRSYWSEGRRRLEAALQQAHHTDRTHARAKALYSLATLTEDNAAKRALLEQCVALYRELGDTGGLAQSLGSLGFTVHLEGDHAAALSLLGESVTLAQKLGDKWMLARVLQTLGSIHLNLSEYAEARSLYEKSMALRRELGDKRGLARILGVLGHNAVYRSDLAEAEALYRESLTLDQELGDKSSVVYGFALLASVAVRRGDPQQAETLLQESTALARELDDDVKELSTFLLFTRGELAQLQGDLVQAETLIQEALAQSIPLYIPYALRLRGNLLLAQGKIEQAIPLFQEGLSGALKTGRKLDIAELLAALVRAVGAQGHLEQAARLVGAAETCAEACFGNKKGFWPGRPEEYVRDVKSIRTQMGEEAFSVAEAEGRTMTPEQALAALEQATAAEAAPAVSQPAVVKPPSAPTYPDDLTAREVEVLRLLAQGWTDGQIAEHLVISPRTVNAHLTSIYRKIGVSSRSAATRYAMEQRLI